MKEAPLDDALDARIAAVMDDVANHVNGPRTPYGIRNVLWAAGLTVVDGGIGNMPGSDDRPIHAVRIWQPIDTAPVEPFDKVPNYYRFECLLQIEHGAGKAYVCEGHAYYVPPPRSRPLQAPKLRWANRLGQCFPKYWMPLPAPKEEADGGTK